MTFIRKLALALLLAFAGSGTAYAQEATVGDWSIYRNEGSCSAIASFDTDTLAWVGYFADKDSATLMIIDDTRFGSLKDEEAFDAHLTFVKSADDQTLETRWTSLPVSGAVLDNGMHGVLVQGPGKGLLDTFANFEYFALMQNGKVVISLRMQNGGAVIKALRACATKS